MKSIATLLSLILSSIWVSLPAHAGEQTVTVVGAEYWAMPRHGEQLLAMAPLRAAVQQLLQQPDAYLVINYPKSESGELWGLEFQAWLVSLGVVSDRVELRAGYKGDDGIAVIMVTPDSAEPASQPSIEKGAGGEDSNAETAPAEESIPEENSPEKNTVEEKPTEQEQQPIEEKSGAGTAAGAESKPAQDEVESQ